MHFFGTSFILKNKEANFFLVYVLFRKLDFIWSIDFLNHFCWNITVRNSLKRKTKNSFRCLLITQNIKKYAEKKKRFCLSCGRNDLNESYPEKFLLYFNFRISPHGLFLMFWVFMLFIFIIGIINFNRN